MPPVPQGAGGVVLLQGYEATELLGHCKHAAGAALGVDHQV